MRTRIFKRRKFPVSDFYGGSSWFSITGKMLGWIMQYIEKNPQYLKFFKHGICVDEVFFSTLVRYSPYVNNITNDHLRFMKWEGSTSGGPLILTKSDINDMIKSEAVWARKFNDMKVIEAVYNNLI